MKFTFEAGQVSGNEVLVARDLSKSFDRPLFRHADLDVMRGDRLFILGPNGCGKTTLLKILTDRLSSDSGFIRLGAKVTIGYYDQVQQGLDEHKTALQELWDAYPLKTETELRCAMATFLFRGDDVFKPIGVMSGGERARLLLLKLMLAGDNFLLLDEPTNHLDIASREALEDALSGYDGTILAVSHDRYFINRMAGRVVVLAPDGIRQVGGDYDAYAAARRVAESAPPPTPKAPSNNTYKQRKEQASAIRRLTTAVRRAEEAVAALEEEIASLNAQLADPATAADYERLTALTALLDEKSNDLLAQMELWEQTQLELEELTSENDG